MASPIIAGVKRSFTAMTDTDDRQQLARHIAFTPPKRPFQTEPPLRESLRQPSASRSTSNTPPSRESLRPLSTSSSTSGTPPSRPSHGNAFDPDASIVLVGIRGSGKSTLAIIASTAMKRRIVDLEKSFQEATGLATVAYKKTHGAFEYQRRQYGVLEAVLTSHQRDCVIVSSWIERGAHALLENFAASHPVIHITRDLEAIQEYLKVADETKIRELLGYTATAFRAVTNFEFFNVSEKPAKLDSPVESSSGALDHASEQKSSGPYLTLKRAERHFLKFLSLVMPKGTIPFIESAFPLASIPTESRDFTYAVSVPLSRLLEDKWNIEDLETGADAIEIVIDDAFSSTHTTTSRSARMSSISWAVGFIRRNVVIPIVYHVPWPSPRDTEPDRRSEYLEYVQHGLSLCPEYITVDLRLEDRILSHVIDFKRTTKVIGTVHLGPSPPPPRWSDPIWMSYCRKAQSLSCDLVRLTRPATSVEDNFEINTLRASVDKLCQQQQTMPLIAFNTGFRGRNSACFNKVLTSVLPESFIGAFPEEDAVSSYVAPSITALQATSALQASFITDALKLYVFGANVGHSMSPAMHNTAIRSLGLDHFYTPHSTNSLGSIRDLIHDPFFAGASIGLPFKVEVISLTHSLSSHAKAIGAVNTLIPLRHLNPDGSIPDNALLFNTRNRAGPVLALYGENTDWIGIRACIRRGLSPANGVRSSTTGLVLGAGGMGRAAVYAMLQLGVKNVVIYNRTPSNAEKLVSHFTTLLARHDIPLLSRSDEEKTRFYVLSSRDDAWPETFRLPTMIVSCIPAHCIGESPAPNFTLPKHWMMSPTGGVVVDFSYKDIDTPLMVQTKAEAHRGWVAMDGLDLLPEQGFAQFELFTGRRAPRRLMRGEVFRSYPAGAQTIPTQLQPRLENITEHEP
ncbi:Uu.00g024990.m01.CDS01 [Anthostomella pinea]|uniref:Uu.00g024990.m01.CDS01 n=1 Tax=Anthostomella pinea TaxID=933095 RepID=A0AAI8V899_9PEZI|nr:Uu.00g024990.m01.CDS01 [Anthostomella pinea]